ncbi:hypothetical protein ACF3TM_19045 [Providencia stuartii]|uniref:hypothetical protein n=1 Tax=Providencia stuartii TaxID=588 RepID=UPI00370BE0AD
MTFIKLPEKAGFALRHAPPAQQRAFLAVIAYWPSNEGQVPKPILNSLRPKSPKSWRSRVVYGLTLERATKS